MINCFYPCVYWSIIHISEDMGKNLSVNKQIDKSIYSICWDTRLSKRRNVRSQWYADGVVQSGHTPKHNTAWSHLWKEDKRKWKLGSRIWDVGNQKVWGHRNKLQLCWMHHGDKLCCLGQSKTGQNEYTFFYDAQQAMGSCGEAASVRNHCTVEGLSVTVIT